MDYHRYSSLGAGSVPPLIPGTLPVAGTGLPDHVGVTASGAPQSFGSGSSSLLPHHHHSSLMFHYGVGGKPPSLPPHLLPSPSAAVHNNSANLSNTISTVGSHNSTSYASSKALVSGMERPATTVPSIGLGSPLTTTAGSSRTISPNSSSFAAALRTLAKQATGPLVNEMDASHCDSSLRSSPKTVNCYGGTSNGPSISVPPVLSMAPTQGHPILSDVHKDVTASVLEMERLTASEELLRGFQPYRAPDMPTPSSVAQAQMRPTLPMDLGHSYPYSSLYPHPLTHQYRLEEQLYLERYGLMRPPMPPYGIGGLSSLYQTSPYLAAARYPPEIVPNSLSVLHPSSALLHERLKLEEDIRQREYEFEMRRERELERERGREREREREKDRRHKDQHDSEKREERLKSSETLRDRSPLSHSSSSMPNVNSISSSSLSSSIKKGSVSGSSSQQQPRSSDRSKHDQSTNLVKSHETNQRSDSKYPGTSKQRLPTIVRPFESTPSPVVSSNLEDKDCKVIKDTHRDLLTMSNSSHKTVWQPVHLTDKSDSSQTTEVNVVTATTATKSATLNGEIPLSSIIQPVPPLCYSSNVGPSVHSPPLPLDQSIFPKSTKEVHGSLQTSVIMAAGGLKSSVFEDSKVPCKEKIIDRADIPSPFLPKPIDTPSSTPIIQAENQICVEISSPDEPPPSPVSRLDLEEQKIRKLRESGIEGEEAEDIIFEEIVNCPSGFICTKGPPLAMDESQEKLEFLSVFNLTTHQSAGEVKLENCERRAKVIKPLILSTEKEEIQESSMCNSYKGLMPLVAPGLNLSEIPRLKGANSLLSDFPNKSRFLQKLDMHPLQAKPKQNEIDAIWVLVLEERLRRYEKAEDDLSTKLLPVVRKLLKTHKDKDDEDQIDLPIKSPPLSPKINENGGCGQLTERALDFFGQHAKNFGISSAKMQAALMDVGLKGFLTDGLYGINNILENDPLLANMSGIDKMIDRLVKSTEGDNEGNSLLLKHIEEVRRSQIAVCQTAQLAQEQVTKLIKTRTQLEAHRTTLHHHLSAVSNLLAQTNRSTSDVFPTPSSNNFNISSLTRQANGEGVVPSGSKAAPNSTAARSSSSSSSNSNVILNATTSSSWPSIYTPFLPATTTNDTLYTKDQKVASSLVTKSPMKPIMTSSSTSKVSRTPVTKTINKTIPSPCTNPGKFNGATNSVLPPLGLLASTSNSLQTSKPSTGVKVLPTSTFPPVAIGAVLGMSPSSQLFYVTTTAGTNNIPPQRSGSQSISKGNKTPSKPPLNFIPYSKNSPSKVHNWLPNN